MEAKLKVKGSKELFDGVINTGLCTLCGACAGSCPYIVPYKGRIVLMDNCTASDGQCYQYCPRTYLDMDAISQHIFGVPYRSEELGVIREVLIARSADPVIKEKGQYGGTVTTLVSLAMEEGLIDGAILTRMDDDRTPKAFLPRNTEEVLQSAGSSYMTCPIVEEYNRLPEDSTQKVGLVATPCQVLAFTKMKHSPPKNRFHTDNARLVIGLFCTWALAPDSFHRFLQGNLNLLQVRKFDIPPPPANRFEAYTSTGRVQFSLDQIREFTMPACAYCLDMTAEFADISVGSVEGIDGWNTVLVRTDTGADLVETARQKGKLEIDKLPPKNLAHLKEASLLKKKRALKEIIKRTGDRNDLIYLGLSPSVASEILE